MREFYVEFNFTETTCGNRCHNTRYFKTEAEAVAFAAATDDGLVGWVEWMG